MSEKTVLVLGGGVAGMTAAHELAERGFDVTLVEKEPDPRTPYMPALGGLAASQWSRVPLPLNEQLRRKLWSIVKKENRPAALKPASKQAEPVEPVEQAESMKSAKREEEYDLRTQPRLLESQPLIDFRSVLRADRRYSKDRPYMMYGWPVFVHSEEVSSQETGPFSCLGKELLKGASVKAYKEMKSQVIETLKRSEGDEVVYLATTYPTVSSIRDSNSDQVNFSTILSNEAPTEGRRHRGRKRSHETEAHRLRKIFERRAEDRITVLTEELEKDLLTGLGLDRPHIDRFTELDTPNDAFRIRFEDLEGSRIHRASFIYDRHNKRFILILSATVELATRQVQNRLSDLLQLRLRQKLLPGEHGYRFFPSFYRNLFDTMDRIPILKTRQKDAFYFAMEAALSDLAGESRGHDQHWFEETRYTVRSNIRSITHHAIALQDESPPTVLPRTNERSLRSWLRTFDAMQRLDVPTRDLTRAQLRMMRFMTSCPERRSTWSSQSFKDHITAEDTSEAFFRALDTWPQALVGLRAQDADAHTMGSTSIQLALDQIKPGEFRDGTLNGPTSTVWLDHWRDYLRQKFGLKFIEGTVTTLEFSEESTRVLLKGEEQPITCPRSLKSAAPEKARVHPLPLQFDYIVCALDLRAMMKVLSVQNPEEEGHPATAVVKLAERYQKRRQASILRELKATRRIKTGLESKRQQRKNTRSRHSHDLDHTTRATMAGLKVSNRHRDFEPHVLGSLLAKLEVPTLDIQLARINAGLSLFLRVPGPKTMSEIEQALYELCDTLDLKHLTDFLVHFRVNNSPVVISDLSQSLKSSTALLKEVTRASKNALNQLSKYKTRTAEGSSLHKLYPIAEERLGSLRSLLRSLTVLNSGLTVEHTPSPQEQAFDDSSWRLDLGQDLPFRQYGGIQFYLKRDYKFFSGHMYYAHSPWRLSSISQMQFQRVRQARGSAYGGQLSVIIGDWQTPGVLIKRPAMLCSPREIAMEVWYQVYRGLEGAEVSPEPPLYFHLDQNITSNNPNPPSSEASRATGSGSQKMPRLNRSKTPFLVNLYELHDWWPETPGDYQVHSGGTVFCGTWLDTYTRLVTMEAANESARHAVNAILHQERIKHPGQPFGSDCVTYNLEADEPPDLHPLRALDRELYVRGLPHFMDILKVEEAIIPMLEDKESDATTLLQLLFRYVRTQGDIGAVFGTWLMDMIRRV